MARTIDQKTGMALSYHGYEVPANPQQQALQLPSGWLIPPTIGNLGVDWNVQKNANGQVENQFNVIVNNDPGIKQVVISFKGSDNLNNFASDFANAGAAEFAKIQAQAQDAYKALTEPGSPYAGYTISVAGHSLGGGMAQSFAVKNGLDAYVYNSLPIANDTINGSYFGGSAGFAAALAAWRVNNRVEDVRTPNDVATWYYSSIYRGTYLSENPTVLPGVPLSAEAKNAVLAIAAAAPPVGVLFLILTGSAHTVGALRDAATGLGIGSDLRYILPAGSQLFWDIPVQIRREWGLLSDSPPISISLNGRFWIVERSDGSKQWVEVDGQGNATITSIGDQDGGSRELSLNINNPAAGLTVIKRDSTGTVISRDTQSTDAVANVTTIVRDLNGDGKPDQIRTTTNDPVGGSKTEQVRNLDSAGKTRETITTMSDANGNSISVSLNADGVTTQVQTVVTDPVAKIQTTTTLEFDPQSPTPEPVMTDVMIVEPDGSSTTTGTAPNGNSSTVHKTPDGKIDRIETDISDGQGGRINQKLELDGNGQIKKRTETKTDADGNTQTETEDITPDAIDDAQDRVDSPSKPKVYYDPLVLDLNADGIQTTSATTNGLHFDHDGNGFAESSGWIKGVDAFLAVDKNGNGTIDTGNELFGDQTLLRSGAKAASGLQALAEWDTIKDGKIDVADSRFNDLRVWRDLNQDGISQGNELQTLTEAGIASLSLSGTATNAPADANGNTLARTGSFTRVDGGTGASGEVVFKRDTTISIPVTHYNVTETVAAMPELSGYGNLLDLHQALAQEVGAGGTAIAAALTAYLAVPDHVARDAALDTLLYTWAGVAGVAPQSRGASMDARQIGFLEAVFGKALSNPDSNAAVQWRMGWQDIREYYGASAVGQVDAGIPRSFSASARTSVSIQTRIPPWVKRISTRKTTKLTHDAHWAITGCSFMIGCSAIRDEMSVARGWLAT